MIAKLPPISQLTIYSHRYLAASKAQEVLETFFEPLYALPECELIDYHMDGSDLEKIKEAINVLSFVSESMHHNIQRIGKEMIYER